MSNENLESKHVISLSGLRSVITTLVCFTALINSRHGQHTTQILSTFWSEIQCSPKCGNVALTYFSDNISKFFLYQHLTSLKIVLPWLTLHFPGSLPPPTHTYKTLMKNYFKCHPPPWSPSWLLVHSHIFTEGLCVVPAWGAVETSMNRMKFLPSWRRHQG